MDEAKRRTLADIGYQIGPCCSLCCNSQFNPASEWGTCLVHFYEHGKHGKRPVSIHRRGRCGTFTTAHSRLPALHGFVEYCTKEVLENG